MKIALWISVFLLLIGLTGFAGNKIGYSDGFDQGISEGIKRYHEQCFNIGGYIGNKKDGTVVVCGAFTTIPKEEKEQLKNETSSNS